MNRVGHAFFKTRMREENAVFGGEVSGHYYFRDFYCADSGTIPALLILELLSRRGARMSELLEPYRSQYFISGEINSEVADQDGKLEELAAALRRRHAVPPRRHLGRLRRLALQRPRVEHRAAAAAVPRVAALTRGHGASPRRGAGSDPFVTAPDRRATSAEDALALAAASRDPPDRAPDPVPGRPGQLLPDRGRAADADRHRAELGQVARRARAGARRARPRGSRTSS